MKDIITMKQHLSPRFWVSSGVQVALLSAIVLGSGCGTDNPARVRAEMKEYAKLKQFDNARAVKVRHSAAGETKEEAAKREMLRDVVNPGEIFFLTNGLSERVEASIAKRRFDDARDAAWETAAKTKDAESELKNPDLVDEVSRGLGQFKERLLHERINPVQFVTTTNEMHKAVTAALAKNDFAAARKAVDAVRPVRVYSTATSEALDGVRKALVETKVPAQEAAKITGRLEPILAKLFADAAYRVEKVEAGEEFKPDTAKFEGALEAFKDALTDQGMAKAKADEVVDAVSKVAETELKKLWRPLESYEKQPPVAIGTTKLNEMLAEAKETILRDVVAPAQIAHRAKALRGKVVPLVESGKLAEARAAIHSFGVVGIPEVDDPVFAVKLGLLNARVNVAEWNARAASLSNAVFTAFAEGDLDKASAVIAADLPVPAYGADVDTALGVAASEAAKIGLSAVGATGVVSTAQERLYDVIAPRPDAEREARIMQAYLDEVAGVAAAGAKADPDWSAVRKALDKAAELLVADDMPRDDANAMMDEVLSGFKALAGGSADVGPSALTTEELNRRLSDFKSELSARVAAGISAKMAAANLVAEATTLSKEELASRQARLMESTAGKVSPEFAESLSKETKTECDKRIEWKAKNDAAAKKAAEQAEKEAAEEAERQRGLALEMAERAASAVDFDARINGFVEAVSDRTEPDLNRVLGDGARILRLRRAGAQVGKEEASSLLVAAVYMGFDDVMDLAVALGADIDGFAAKDELKRPVILVAMQYGFKGRAEAVLAKADRTARDARDDGALHYAVRGGNGTALVELLRAGIDAKAKGFRGATPIVLAADIGYGGFVQALVPFSDLEAADEEGFTALLRAAQDGRVDIVRNLVAAGASLAAKTKDGDGALELAAKANAPALLGWLLDERKVAPTARVVDQLVVAGNVPTLQQMVAHGAKLLDGHLAAAIVLKDFPMVKYLVNQGMDVNAKVVREALAKMKPDIPDPANDGTYYGPEGASIRAFLYEQGLRPFANDQENQED